MYAIIRTGGKQAKVRPGDVLEVELLKGADAEISFTPLLVVDGEGSAITDQAKLGDLTVTARVLGESKGPKIDIFKYKNKTGYRRHMGHRQRYTQIEVVSIGDTEQDEKPAKKAATPKAKSPEAASPKAAAPKGSAPKGGAPAKPAKKADEPAAEPTADSEEE
jgi:large subunit ribosomal protein L21